MGHFWEVAVAVAGVGAVVSFVLWSLYREWIRLPIWQQLTKHQQFVLFILFLTFTFFFATAGLVSFTVIQLRRPDVASRNELIQVIHTNFASAKQRVTDAERATNLPLTTGLPEIEKLIARKIDALEKGEFVLANELDNELDDKVSDWSRFAEDKLKAISSAAPIANESSDRSMEQILEELKRDTEEAIRLAIGNLKDCMGGVSSIGSLSSAESKALAIELEKLSKGRK